MEDPDVKTYQQARLKNRRGKHRRYPAATTNQDTVRERSKGKGRAEFKASSRGRDAAFADWHDHSSSDEGNRLAAALCPRLLGGRGAKETST
jgi:hypothetical protein